MGKSFTSNIAETWGPFSKAQAVEGTMVGPHLQTPEDIVSMPYFPTGCKSLLSKCLTPEIWEQCKDRRDKFGFTFRQSIMSGSKWTESGVGVYAGSHDSYYAFAPFMDKIIQTYHGHKPTDKHISDMDHTHLKCPPFPADEDKMINSTRIRVARNLAAYPLGTCVTPTQRAEVESHIVSALNEFTGELKGKYYSLETMTESEKKQLIADHFLFKGGDKYLESCGLEREWPKNRGIFHNDAKTFLVWVNEEDQLRIISMQKGSNILEVFTRLSVAAGKIEEKAKFANDDHFGYVATCPTNMGTGLRASVHIHLPKLMKEKALMQSIADKYHVQIRGIHGEHTETDDGIFDISNLRRLGRNEVDLVQDMYDGVKALIKEEKKL
jgi:creatine kinase/arginine kinase